MGRRIVIVVAGVTLTGVAGLAALASTLSGDRPKDGPMEVPYAHGWATSEAVGDPFTDGMEVLRLSGDMPAVIEDVRLVGDEGLELVGVKLAPPSRGIGSIQYHALFPPKDDPDLGDVRLVDAIGAHITPLGKDGQGATWELLLGIQATEDGYLVREGVEIDYRVAGKEYTTYRPAYLGVCTSPEYEVRGDCPAPEGE